MRSVKEELTSTELNNGILQSISNHCVDLNNAIGGMLLRNSEKPVDDVLIDPSTYSSTVVLQTLNETKRLVNVMKDEVAVMVNVN